MHRKLFVFVAALAVVTAACGGGGDSETKTKAAKKSTTTTEQSAPTTGPGTDGSTVTTTKTGATATTAKRGSTATTTKSAAGPTANPNAAPAPARPGTYDYAQSGSVNGEPAPPNGTLVVVGSGASQVFKRYFDPAKQPSELHYSFRDDGPFITKVVAREQNFVITCNFDAPVPAPPWPATAGRSFSGSTTCDNGLHAELTGTVGGKVHDNVGGQSVEAIVINSTLHITGTILGVPVDVTVKDTQHWAPSLRVPTYSHEVISGTVSGDVTSTLKSVNPR